MSYDATNLEALVAAAREVPSALAVEILASLATLQHGEIKRAENNLRRTMDSIADELGIDHGCSADDILAVIRREREEREEARTEGARLMQAAILGLDRWSGVGVEAILKLDPAVVVSPKSR